MVLHWLMVFCDFDFYKDDRLEILSISVKIEW